MDSITTATPRPRRRSGPPPSGPRGVAREVLLAARVDPTERDDVHAALGELGYPQGNTGIRALLLDLADGRVRLVRPGSAA